MSEIISVQGRRIIDDVLLIELIVEREDHQEFFVN